MPDASFSGRQLRSCHAVLGASSLGPGDQIALSHWLCPPGTPVTSICISPAAQLVALGLGSGEVALYRLWGAQGMEPLRTISLREWGYESEVTGSVSDLQWSPDSRALGVGLYHRHVLKARGKSLCMEGALESEACIPLIHAAPQWLSSSPAVVTSHVAERQTLLAGFSRLDPCTCFALLQVGWRRSGLGIWSPAGCRLMCTLRQTGAVQNGSAAVRCASPHGLEGGISVLAWGYKGYCLLVAESGSAAQVSPLQLE